MQESSFYRGWDVHSWSRDFSSREANVPLSSLKTPLSSDKLEEILTDLEKRWPEKKHIYDKFKSRINEVDSALCGVNHSALLLACWLKVSEMADESIWKLFGETLDDCGLTCLQGDTHRFWSLLRGLTEGELQYPSYK